MKNIINIFYIFIYNLFNYIKNKTKNTNLTFYLEE